MKCPKCTHTMIKVNLKEIELNRCTSCGGLWLDAGEVKSIKEDDAKVGYVVDTGNNFPNSKWNSITEIDCPYCEIKMTHHSYSKDKKIKYEACGSCYGVFMDAGELASFDK